MMEQQQQVLVSKIQAVHKRLREWRHESGQDETMWNEIWRQHKNDEVLLKEYAEAMHTLATKIWQPRNSMSDDDNNLVSTETSSSKTGSAIKCRLDWVHETCRKHFVSYLGCGRKLKLLDVGSCYNPFKRFSSLFEPVPLDLFPAPGFESEVFKCDFLELKVLESVGVDKTTSTGDNLAVDECLQSFSKNTADAKSSCSKTSESDKFLVVDTLPSCSFDVVVFSYFLEYLPHRMLRYRSCQKAARLLKVGGLLFILSPDSSSVTPDGNCRLIKALKVGMAFLGFRRLYFEKLKHLWCMGFVLLSPEDRSSYLQSSRFEQRDFLKVFPEFDTSLEILDMATDDDALSELFKIPQDFNKHKDTPVVESAEKFTFCMDELSELPFLDTDQNIR